MMESFHLEVQDMLIETISAMAAPPLRLVERFLELCPSVEQLGKWKKKTRYE